MLARSQLRPVIVKQSETGKQHSVLKAAQQGGGNKHLPTGLKQALLDRLPIGKDNGITQAEIRLLIADIPYAESGLSSTLSNLAMRGEAYRTEARPYRYYK